MEKETLKGRFIFLTQQTQQFIIKSMLLYFVNCPDSNIERFVQSLTPRFGNKAVALQHTVDYKDRWDLLLQQCGEAMVPANPFSDTISGECAWSSEYSPRIDLHRLLHMM